MSTPTLFPGHPARSPVGRTKQHPHRRELTDEVCSRLRGAPNNQALRDSLIELNLPVAESVASAFSGRGVDSEDLRQVAYLALVKAARRFDPRRGSAFLPFAVPTIRGEIRRYFRDLGWVVRPPRAVQERQASAFSARDRLVSTLNRQPSVAEIAADIGESPHDVRRALQTQTCFTPHSLDRPVSDTSQTTLGDVLGSVDPAFLAAEARATLAPALRTLTNRDRRILVMRFVDQLTQREIAIELHLTQTLVSRVLLRIFDDLRAAMS